ncbi:MAG TPA: pilus assembly protein N-terminal domain-containing protein [Alphaproteobacteria bacterium]|nr:pilus assembly protein N-terminal domain-containing protein [Alphaproteobacteria bacterium]
MSKTACVILLPCLLLCACADSPKVVQTSSDASKIHMIVGQAAQVAMPYGERVQSAIAGDPSVVTVVPIGDVVNLVPGKEAGETNLIVRTMDEDNRPDTYQYRIYVVQ